MKYLSTEDLSRFDQYVDPDLELVTNDTIDEEKLVEVVEATGRQEELLICAIQIAIVGQGNRTYGKYRYKGDDKDMVTLFKDCGVKYNNVWQMQLAPEDLTPRRLTRIFRKQIKDYLDKNITSFSYLYQKYSPRDVKFRSICFPGAEHIVETVDEINYLMQTYTNLDNQLAAAGKQHGIGERIKRVLLAKGKLMMQNVGDNLVLVVPQHITPAE